jgi:hypothetical protein
MERYNQAVEKHKEVVEKAKAAGTKPPNAPGRPWMPSGLYNGMLAALLDFRLWPSALVYLVGYLGMSLWPTSMFEFAALSNFLLTVEAYPDLKANQNFLSLQEELSSTENKIAFSRQAYNDQVLFFNNKTQMFPFCSTTSKCSKNAIR